MQENHANPSPRSKGASVLAPADRFAGQNWPYPQARQFQLPLCSRSKFPSVGLWVGFGWVLCTCGPRMFEAPPETPGYVLQSQQISAARGHAVSSCSPRQEETLSLRQLSEIPNVLLCPAGMGRRLRGGEKPPKGPGLWQQPSAGAGAAKFSSITSIGTQRAARLGKEGKGRARDPARPRGAACGLCKPRRLALGSERV